MICLLELGYKAVTMVVVQTIFNLLTLIINFIYCKYRLHIKIFIHKFDWKFLKEVALYSFWILLNVIMDRIYWNTGQFVLGAVVGTTAVAVFAIAIQLQHMYMNFSTAVTGLFLPKVTGMVTRNNNHKEISDLFIRTGRIQYIVMAMILSGFIVFGRQFISVWAGPEYDEAYIMTVLFFISLLPPLIQNLGITILQARNQMKFRSLLYIVIATLSLILQIILTKLYGGIGCTTAIAGALILGQGIIMNIYYYKKQGLDILNFWGEIIKMSFVPAILSCVTIFILHYFNIKLNTYSSLLFAITIFILTYIPLFYHFSMNAYERNFIINSIRVIRRKVKL